MSTSWLTDWVWLTDWAWPTERAWLVDQGFMDLLLIDRGLSLIALLGGLLVGAIFFIGLHQTLRALPQAAHPVRLLALSLALRFALVAGAGWLLLQTGGSWLQILIALAAMMLMRWLITRWLLQPLRLRADPIRRTDPKDPTEPTVATGRIKPTWRIGRIGRMEQTLQPTTVDTKTSREPPK